MKTREELNEIKNEVDALSEKLKELSEEEMKEVTGGMKIVVIKSTKDACETEAPGSLGKVPEIHKDERYVML